VATNALTGFRGIGRAINYDELHTHLEADHNGAPPTVAVKHGRMGVALQAMYDAADDDGDNVGALQAAAELKTRFNMTDSLRATKDMIETIQEPALKLDMVLLEIITVDLATQWNQQYREFIQLGDTPQVAAARSDAYIALILKEKMKILKIRYPYRSLEPRVL
jgi:hypothetical protein